MIQLPFHNNKKLLLAFEYGVVLADVAKQQNVEVTKELIEKAEKIILNEFKNNSASRLATNMIPNLLTVFETRLDV